MIQDILPYHFHNEYTPRQPQKKDYVFSYAGREMRMKEDHTFWQWQDLPVRPDAVYLFEIDDRAFFLADLSALPGIWVSIQALRDYQPRVLAFAAITGFQLYTWLQNSRFCGRCGTGMLPDQKERAMRCPSCGNIVYPRINPAVIVGIIHDGKILVTKYAHGLYQHYALVAGYAETGETIEETVRREVKEETGLEVSDLRYYKSQPWSFTQTLLFGFWCHVKGSAEIHLQTSELRLAEWHGRQDPINDSSDASLTHEMIELFRKGLVD